MADRLNILVTGGSAGIGRATALELAGRGHHVMAAARRVDALRQLAHSGIDAVPMDVTDSGSVANAYRRVEQLTDGHGVDVLINNAGHALFGPVETVPDSAVRQQFDTNVFGLLNLTRTVLPAMRARGSGRIINLSSLVGRFTLPGAGVYSATKFALEALSDALRMELAPFGVSVVLIEPGYVATELLATSQRLTGGAAEATAAYTEMATKIDKYLEQQFADYTVPVAWVAEQIAEAAETADPEARYLIPAELGQMVEFIRALPDADADRALLDAVGLIEPVSP